MLRALLAVTALMVASAIYIDQTGDWELVTAALLPVGFLVGILWLVS